MKRLAPAAVLGLALLLSACGSSAYVPPPTQFPTTENLPTLTIANRVINLNEKGSGYKYAKISLAVEFQDTTGSFAKADGANLAKLQTTFAGNNTATIEAFNDILTTDVSQKSPADLATAQGKEALRQQLQKDFNARLAPGQAPVLYVAFTDFVMQ